MGSTILQSVCTLEDKLSNSDWYLFSNADNGIEFNEYSGVFLFHCLTKEEGLKRANISLSFRQVSGFDFENKFFYFYGLTSGDLEASSIISFFTYLISGKEKEKSPVEIKCTSGDAVKPGSGIAAVRFKCDFADIKTKFDSIEIGYTDFVGGLPEDDTRLNHAKTDEAIKNGNLTDLSNAEPPQMLKLGANPFDVGDASKGIMKLTLPLGGIDKTYIKEGKTFTINFAYPNGVYIKFYIDSILGDIFTLKGYIFGKVDNQPLVFEQTAVSIDGVELFVLPSFTIPDITTEGFKGEIPIPGSGGESDKPEDESDKPGDKSDKPDDESDKPGREGDSDKPGREGESDKPGDESDKPGREGDSDKPGREGESDKPDDESDKPGREDESDKPGASNKPEQSGPDNKTEPSGAK